LFRRRSLLARLLRSAYGGFLTFSARTGLNLKGAFGSMAVDRERLKWADTGPTWLA
jgi:hypothetical protein